ncbi:hypothetical protein FACS18948_2440 [Clostridia bacterium]|nr:hypothetical protein FACS18948_2440 [Clostridia bacterium]
MYSNSRGTNPCSAQYDPNDVYAAQYGYFSQYYSNNIINASNWGNPFGNYPETIGINLGPNDAYDQRTYLHLTGDCVTTYMADRSTVQEGVPDKPLWDNFVVVCPNCASATGPVNANTRFFDGISNRLQFSERLSSAWYLEHCIETLDADEITTNITCAPSTP